MPVTRQERTALLEALEQRVKQFRRDDDIWPFRRPHDPLDLTRLITFVLGQPSISPAVDAIRSRSIFEMRWNTGDRWELWVATLPSGIHVYVGTDGAEHWLLASAKRGSAVEADRFFLELLAESRGGHFGIEMSGGAPARIRTTIDDRALLVDLVVDLFEGTEAESEVRDAARGAGNDFRECVEQWLAPVLSAPVPGVRSKRYRRLREVL